MNRRGFRQGRRPTGAELVTADDWLALPPLRAVDEALALGRPEAIATFYSEEFFLAKAAQQVPLWSARGKQVARPYLAQAAELEPAVRELEFLIGEARERVRVTGEAYRVTVRVLGPYTRRAPNAKRAYGARTLGLVAGDVVGVAGAAILLGEPVPLAILQALASGTAAVTSGVIAHELKDSRLARKRQKQPRDLSKEEKGFAHLFRGGDRGEGLVKLAAGGALLIGLCIAGSVFALRTATEGSVAGWAFGLLAAAVSLASWANVYGYTDEVADLIDTSRVAFGRAQKKLSKLAADRRLARHGRAVASAASIESEHERQGEAARAEVEALGKQHLHESPGVAGHGWPHASIPSSENGHRSYAPVFDDVASTDRSARPNSRKRRPRGRSDR